MAGVGVAVKLNTYATNKYKDDRRRPVIFAIQGPSRLRIRARIFFRWRMVRVRMKVGVRVYLQEDLSQNTLMCLG